MQSSNLAILTGHASGSDDFGDFPFAKPVALVGPLSSEYNTFLQEKSSAAKPGSGLKSPSLKSDETSPPPNQESNAALPEASTTEAHPLASTHANQPLRDGTAVTLVTTSVSDSEKGSSAVSSTGQEHPDIVATEEARPTAVTQPSHGVKKRGLDVADTMALAPQPKRAQTGRSMRTLRSRSATGGNGNNATVATDTSYESCDSDTSDQKPRGHRRTTKRCGNWRCRSRNHELADCLGPPSTLGDIDGCPLCNTEDHDLDSCPDLPRTSRAKLFEVLITRRANKPPIRTRISIISLTVELSKTEELANTMPLLKGTVKHSYRHAEPWKQHKPTLTRDPSLSSDPVKLLEMLCARWDYFLSSYTLPFYKARQLPKDLTVFKKNWIGKLVPYNKAYVRAGVYVFSQGRHTFITEQDWKRAQKVHRHIVQGGLDILKKKRASTGHP